MSFPYPYNWFFYRFTLFLAPNRNLNAIYNINYIVGMFKMNFSSVYRFIFVRYENNIELVQVDLFTRLDKFHHFPDVFLTLVFKIS